MKWQAAKYSRKERQIRRMAAMGDWHARFAWWPTAIPEQKFEEIVVPRHWVWLEHYEMRYYYGDWMIRSYTGRLTVRQMARQ